MSEPSKALDMSECKCGDYAFQHDAEGSMANRGAKIHCACKVFEHKPSKTHPRVSSHRAMAAAALLLACSAARAGERDRLGTVRECWAAIRALPDSRTVASTGDPAWQAYQAILDSPYCSGGAIVLARELLREHPEMQQ